MHQAHDLNDSKAVQINEFRGKGEEGKENFFPPPKTIFDWLCELSNIQFPPTSYQKKKLCF